MKSKKFYLIIILIVAVFYNIQAQEELVESKHEPLLIGRPYPALVGIEKFYILIEAHQSLPDEGGLDWEKLDARVKEKLEHENIEVAFVTDTPNMTRPGAPRGASMLPESVTGNLPGLIIFIDMLKLEESQMYVFHIQTSFRKKAYLFFSHPLS